ncbi:glycosyltransferase family 2 protein [Arcanobacterium hippocoleae]|uniref:glycosyltransferase family 2 protein n=1 Tax=Arcanobacterium hippocoleae TaxID=149017 RepID=UPI0033427CDD
MPETKPLVSIVVPVYNSANFLPDLFASLRTQTYHNLEIICVNDGSQDHSLDILQKYAAADSRIIVVDKHNTGAAKTRNVGMMVAAGKYLCFVDSDDFIEPDTISTLVQTAETHRADAVVFDIDNYDNQLGTYYPNYALSKNISRCIAYLLPVK